MGGERGADGKGRDKLASDKTTKPWESLRGTSGEEWDLPFLKKNMG